MKQAAFSISVDDLIAVHRMPLDELRSTHFHFTWDVHQGNPSLVYGVLPLNLRHWAAESPGSNMPIYPKQPFTKCEPWKHTNRRVSGRSPISSSRAVNAFAMAPDACSEFFQSGLGLR